MEFPHLGQHCSEPTCNRLDFLPMKCDSCNKVFCSSHFNYTKHVCPGAHKKDVQVPVCPLCNEPVPTPPGVAPDLTVGQHIDQQCKSDTKKIFTNQCSYKGCKRKELIPVTCSQCKRNFCLRHRHTADHECGTSQASGMAARGPFLSASELEARTMAASAAENRRTRPTTLFDANVKPNAAALRTAAAQRPTVSQSHMPSAAVGTQEASTAQVQKIQGNMTEDEALARALALSILELDETADRNRRNEAAASAGGQRNATVSVGGQDARNSSKDKCSLS